MFNLTFSNCAQIEIVNCYINRRQHFPEVSSALRYNNNVLSSVSIVIVAMSPSVV